ncbi:MAG: hypothetical protein JXR94_02020 [Candidatus Hydrogenedentes bacterium]|nr:hypothetical protein [Candidatus Hydrogenedentota bacterium]
MTAKKKSKNGKKAAKRDKAPHPIYQLKVTLRGSDPPIWRRIQVPRGISLEGLHHVLQAAMGWEDDHLHQFTIKGRHYGETHPELESMEDEAAVRLDWVVGGPRSKFIYEYDFGDSWEHEIVFERSIEPEAGVEYPVCVDGARACPAEDSGGIWGYEQKVAILADPEDEYYGEIAEWMGKDWDAEAFTVEGANRRFGRLGALSSPADDAGDEAAMAGTELPEFVMRIRERLAEQLGFATQEELAAHLATLPESEIATLAKGVVDNDPTEEAQLLAYQAMDTDDEEEALDLAEEALDLDPDCVDALRIKAQIDTNTDEEWIEQLRIAVAKGEARLGKAVFEEYAGRLTERIAALPYLRARLALADALSSLDRLPEAARHWATLLTQDKTDIAAVRFRLLATYLELKDLENAQGLFKQFPDEPRALFLWGRVLERLLSGDEPGANQALERARQANPRVPALLLEPGGLCREDIVPEPGTRDDAVHCAMCLDAAWEYGLAWLKRRTEGA